MAITLLSMICLALFSAIHLSTRAWERSSAPLEKALETQAIAGLIRRQLAQTHAIFTQDGGNISAVFAGSAESLRFVAPLPAHRGVAGLYALELLVNARGELVLGYEIYRPDQHLPIESMSFEHVEVLYAGAEELRFEYAYVLAGDQTEWVQSATGGGQFPEAVRLIDIAGREPRVLGTFGITARDSRFRVSLTGVGGAGQQGNEADVEPPATEPETGPPTGPEATPPAEQSAPTPIRTGRSLEMWRGSTPYYEDFEYVPPTETGPRGTPGCGTDYIC